MSIGYEKLIKGSEREVKDVLYLIALQGLNYLAPIIVLPYLMVILGAEKFGYIGFGMAVSQYLMIIVDFGFNLSATKRIALAKGNQEEVNRIFTATFYAKMFLLAISFLIAVGLSFIPRFDVYRPAMLILFTTVAGNAFLFIFLFQGLGQIRWVSIVNCIAKLSILPLTFVFVKQPDDYLIAAFLQGFVSILAAAISICIIAKNRWVKLGKFNCCDFKNELAESTPLFLSNAATSIYTACFVIILGIFASPDSVGRYSAADRIIRAITLLIFVPVSQAFFPKISTLAKSDKGRAVEIINKLLIATSTLCLLAGIVCFLTSPYIQMFLGETYKNTESLFKIMAFTPLLVSFGGIFAQLVIIALGNAKDKIYYRNTYFIAGGVSLTSVIILAFTLQEMGAAIALVLTELTVTVLMTARGIKIIRTNDI